MTTTTTECPTDDWTLERVRTWLLDQATSDGAKCPCCTQFAKVYHRKLTTQTARALVLMYRDAGTEFVYMPGLLQRKQADETKARYWGLIEPFDGEREDGSSRVGWWRLTPLGVAFVRGEVTVAKYAKVYDGRCVGFDASETVTIHDALGTRFRFDDLMADR